MKNHNQTGFQRCNIVLLSSFLGPIHKCNMLAAVPIENITCKLSVVIHFSKFLFFHLFLCYLYAYPAYLFSNDIIQAVWQCSYFGCENGQLVTLHNSFVSVKVFFAVSWRAGFMLFQFITCLHSQQQVCKIWHRQFAGIVTRL